MTRVAVDGVPPFRLYRAALTGLEPGEAFAYRVRRGGVGRLRGRAARRGSRPGRPHRFVVFGDGGGGHLGAERRSPTRRTWPGPITWSSPATWSTCEGGSRNTSTTSSRSTTATEPARPGALRCSARPRSSTAPGNHDLIERDLDTHPDGLAYFYYWAQPLNGPEAPAGSPGFPRLEGLGRAAERRSSTRPGPAYPRMANYSFDYGDVHWTVLDTNTYADWTDPALRAWLDADLASARRRAPGGSWRSTTRRSARRRPTPRTSGRGSSPRRSRPTGSPSSSTATSTTTSAPAPCGSSPTPPGRRGQGLRPDGQVEGRWTLDTAYDGPTRTRPDGVIYVVTGAGGARLYNTEQSGDPASWQPYTARFVSDTHSLTVVDVTPDALTVRQVSSDGRRDRPLRRLAGRPTGRR